MADHVELVDGLTALWLKVVTPGGDETEISYLDTNRIMQIYEIDGNTAIEIEKGATYYIGLPLSEVMQVLLKGCRVG